MFKCPAAPSAWGAQQLEREFGSEEVFSTQKSRYMNGLETWQQREQENVRKCIANKTAQFSLSQNVITPTRECWPSPYNLFMFEYFGFSRAPVTLHWWWPQPQLYWCTSKGGGGREEKTLAKFRLFLVLLYFLDFKSSIITLLVPKSF